MGRRPIEFRSEANLRSESPPLNPACDNVIEFNHHIGTGVLRQEAAAPIVVPWTSRCCHKCVGDTVRGALSIFADGDTMATHVRFD